MQAKGVLLVAAVGLVAGAAEYALHYRGLLFPDAFDYAQMARETARGRVFGTLIERPLTVTMRGHVPFTDVSRPPLYPLLLGGWFLVSGTGELQAAACSAILWLAAGLVLHSLARRFLDPAPAAAVGVLFFLSTSLLPYVWSGMSEPLFILVLLVAFLQLSRPRGGTYRAVAGGLLVGAACLVRGAGILAVPPALLLGWGTSARTGRARIALIAALVLPLGAWVAYRRITGGAAPLAFNLAQLPMFTEHYPRYSLFRMSTPVNPVAFTLSNPGGVAAKFVSGVRVYLAGALRLLPIPATLAWVAAVVFPRYGRQVLPLRNATLALLLLHVLVLPFYEPTPRFLLPLVPFLVLLGTAQVWGLAPPKSRTPTLLVWAGLCLLGLLSWVRSPSHTPDRFSPADRAVVASLARRDAVVVTDVPWRTAWELGLRSVWIPQDEATLRTVEKRMPKLEMFLLTPALTRMVESERPAFWLSVWEGRSWPAGYEAPPVTTGGRTVVGIRSPGGVDR